MYCPVDPHKLADIQSLHDKLQQVDPYTLNYICGRVDQAVEDQSKKNGITKPPLAGRQ